ncbi:glucoside xylosyltransferase 1-like [Octopus vulgaris]|uniref:Glucoside xylosyltransferase 1-like n=2 Tax=Octopus TaxID=6643 RepID=A0AA36BB40_OCTVU|nr:glucoside xylosyltransferase 1 isoform X1 [Octopus sinensis]CAI9730271.1 glucoside xylosyltransferase 1-like [Octopus vulgaris]
MCYKQLSHVRTNMIKATIFVLLLAIIFYYSLRKLIHESFLQDGKSPGNIYINQKNILHEIKLYTGPENTKAISEEPLVDSKFDVQPIMEGSKKNKHFLHQKNSIHLSLVVCGDRLEESVVLLKSAVLLTDQPLVFHLFVEDHLQKNFQDQLDFWPDSFRNKIFYRIFAIQYPSDQNQEEWWKLFKPCASQRLFIPHILIDVDSLLYVDTDVLFLSPVTAIWEIFSKFSESHTTGLAPEHEDAGTGWYNRFAQHPFFKPLGVNSGVMLMNLTRIRCTKWQSLIIEYYKTYRYKIVYGDQDLVNIYFHFNADELYIFDCHWNYRPDHCMYMSVCKSAEKEGAAIIHGCRRVMHNDQQPAFRSVYRTFKKHRFGADLQHELLPNLKRELSTVASTNCGKVAYIFVKRLQGEVLKILQ